MRSSTRLAEGSGQKHVQPVGAGSGGRKARDLKGLQDPRRPGRRPRTRGGDPMARTRAGQLRAAVTAALGSVTDPELDRSLIELGFARADVDDAGRVTIEVRLPTFWGA